MSSSSNQRQNIAYGLSQALLPQAPLPVVAKRAPTTADFAQPGTVWIEGLSATGTTVNTAWILVSIINNSANWLSIGGSSGAGVFASLTVTPGPTSLTGAFTSNAGTFTVTSGTSAINISADAAATTVNLGTGAGAKTVGIGSQTSTSLTSIFSGTGAITLSPAATGTIVLGNAGMTGTITIGASTAGQAINIGTAAGDDTITIGNVTTGTTVVINTPASTGSIQLNGGWVQLPGPVRIYTGAGAPSAGLAIETGDLYINTTASTTTTRLYIATGAGAWTYFTSNA